MYILKKKNDNTLKFDITIEYGGSVPQNSPHYDISRSIIAVKREENSDKYFQAINIRGQDKLLSHETLTNIEKLTLKYLPKFVKCEKIFKTKGPFSVMVGAFYSLKVTAKDISLQINGLVDNSFIYKTCEKYKQELLEKYTKYKNMYDTDKIIDIKTTWYKLTKKDYIDSFNEEYAGKYYKKCYIETLSNMIAANKFYKKSSSVTEGDIQIVYKIPADLSAKMGWDPFLGEV